MRDSSLHSSYKLPLNCAGRCSLQVTHLGLVEVVQISDLHNIPLLSVAQPAGQSFHFTTTINSQSANKVALVFTCRICSARNLRWSSLFRWPPGHPCFPALMLTLAGSLCSTPTAHRPRLPGPRASLLPTKASSCERTDSGKNAVANHFLDGGGCAVVRDVGLVQL